MEANEGQHMKPNNGQHVCTYVYTSTFSYTGGISHCGAMVTTSRCVCLYVRVRVCVCVCDCSLMHIDSASHAEQYAFPIPNMFF